MSKFSKVGSKIFGTVTALSVLIGVVASSVSLSFPNSLIASADGSEESFSCSLSRADEINAAFDIYSGDNASETGLKKSSSMEDKWLIENNQLISSFDAKVVEAWEDKDRYVTTAIYNAKKYTNFEMSVNCSNLSGFTNEQHDFFKYFTGGNAGYFPPSLIFGVEEPTKWVTSLGGGYSAGVYNDGNTFLSGCINGNFSELGDNTLRPTSMNGGIQSYYVLKLRVIANQATVTVSHPYNSSIPDFSYTYNIGGDYKGGYVGFAAPGAVMRFWDFKVTALPETEEITIKTIHAPEPVKVPTGVLPEDLVLPATVKVTASDDKQYDLAVSWNTAGYNRFNLGNYTISGSLTGILTEDFKILKVNNEIAEMTVSVEGTENLTPIKVACVGDSITFGSGPSILWNYPNRLQKVLGGEYDVQNFGLDAATLLKSGNLPYVTSSNYEASLNFDPNIIIIMLGTNDSKPRNWKDKDNYVSDYKELIGTYKSLQSNPTIFVATSPTVTVDNYEISGKTVKEEIVPLQYQVASETGCQLIDMNAFTEGRKTWFSDGVHPNSLGYEHITQKLADTIAIPAPLESISLNKSSSYIFVGESETFTVSYKPAVILESKDVTWSIPSYQQRFATVDENGTVTALRKGFVDLTAECHGKTTKIRILTYNRGDKVTLNLNDEETLASNLQNFDCYYSNNAEYGLSPELGFAHYWELTSKGLTRTEDTIGDMLWGENNVSSLVYKRSKFRNFEMEVELFRKEAGQYQYPMVAFGIKDPAKYITQKDGGIGVFATAEGGLYVTGQIEGNVNTWLGGGAPESGYNREGTHTLNIKVEYNTVTVTLKGAKGETCPEPIKFELGDTDMDGYVALIGKANPCGFSKFSIKELLDRDVKRVNAKEVIGTLNMVETSVGTRAEDLMLPQTVEVLGEDGITYNAKIKWDYDGYNRYVRDIYTLNGKVIDTLTENAEHVKLYGMGLKVKVDVKLTGDKDLTSEDTVCFDFNGKSELKDFKCYYAPTFADGLSEIDPLVNWDIIDGRLKRLDDDFKSWNGWTEERSLSRFSSLVYTGRTYKNFELDVDYQRDGSSIWWAMLGFAIKDPTAFITEENGGIAAYAEMEGRQVFWSYERTTGAHTTPFSSYDFTGKHHMKLIVKNGIASLYLDDYDKPFHYQLRTEMQQGGYISLMTNANMSAFDNLVIKALPDDKVSGEKGFDSSKYPTIRRMNVEKQLGASLSGVKGNSPNTSDNTLNNVSYAVYSVILLAVSYAFVVLSNNRLMYNQCSKRSLSAKKP